MFDMRLINADELEQEIIKRAFEGKMEWSANDVRKLIRSQKDAPLWMLVEGIKKKGFKVEGRW